MVSSLVQAEFGRPRPSGNSARFCRSSGLDGKICEIVGNKALAGSSTPLSTFNREHARGDGGRLGLTTHQLDSDYRAMARPIQQWVRSDGEIIENRLYGELAEARPCALGALPVE